MEKAEIHHYPGVWWFFAQVLSPALSRLYWKKARKDESESVCPFKTSMALGLDIIPKQATAMQFSHREMPAE